MKERHKASTHHPYTDQALTLLARWALLRDRRTNFLFSLQRLSGQCRKRVTNRLCLQDQDPLLFETDKDIYFEWSDEDTEKC